MEADPVSETLCFLLFRIPDDGQCPETVILIVIHHHQNPSDSIINDVLCFSECTCVNSGRN
jgi:hypothetical protein